MRISRRTKASGAENRTFAGFRRRPPAVAAFQRSEHRSDTLLNDAAACLSQSPFAFSQSSLFNLSALDPFHHRRDSAADPKAGNTLVTSITIKHQTEPRSPPPCGNSMPGPSLNSTPVSQLHPSLSSVSAQMYETLWSELSSRFEYSKGVCLLICTPNCLLPILPSMHS